MRPRVLCLLLAGVAALAIGWSLWPSAGNTASAQIPGGETTVGRYKFIPGGLMTTVMIDTQTGKMYALTPGMMDGPFARDPAFAWVPITKFEDLDSYRKWHREQMEKFGRDRGWDDKRPVPPPKVEEFKDKAKDGEVKVETKVLPPEKPRDLDKDKKSP
jgi:hypothetical protein